MKIAALIVVGFVCGCGVTPPPPSPLPPADSSPVRITYGVAKFDAYLQASDQAIGGLMLTVTRVGGTPLDYSEGRVAKYVAERFCADRGHQLDPNSFGHFTALNTWIFEGGCL